uniref:Translational initiation factor 1 n=1 Tax=Ophiopogon japonicus TaxID=100506 RepID=A0A7D5SP48_9ASPA|nr:translational initiation factor 1 [Ophiopogon japonicus]QLH57428.1 translational initiation factor 1 [Ophiopogon japonicus]
MKEQKLIHEGLITESRHPQGQ